MTRKQKVSLALPVLLSLLLMIGCASVPSNVSDVACGAQKISWEVAKEAKISNFECKLDKFGMDPALIFSMDLTNASDTPLRFRVNIFLEDMDKAAGHLVPRKGKPPVVEPGQTASVKIPFIKTETLSDKVLVVVKTMSE
ncbi:MAG: hypothetical protein PVG78_00385 [Desulfobacterales bacterium]|jgi:hypothetical protein